MRKILPIVIAGIIAIGFMCVSPVIVKADNPKGSVEIAIYSGWSFVSAEGSNEACWYCEIIPMHYRDENTSSMYWPFTTVTQSLKDSILFGFKAGYYMNDNAEIEGNFGFAPNHEIKTDWNDWCQPGDVCPLFESQLYPYFQDNQNVVAYHYDANFVYNFLHDSIRPYVTIGIGGISYDLPGDVKTSFTTNLGLGAKFYFKKVGLRFEINDHLIPNHFLSGKTENNLQIQYSFFFLLP